MLVGLLLWSFTLIGDLEPTPNNPGLDIFENGNTSLTETNSLLAQPRKVESTIKDPIINRKRKNKDKTEAKDPKLKKKEKPQFLSDVIVDKKLVVETKKLEKEKPEFTITEKQTNTKKAKEEYEKSVKEFRKDESEKEEKQKKMERDYQNALTNEGIDLEKASKYQNSFSSKHFNFRAIDKEMK